MKRFLTLFLFLPAFVLAQVTGPGNGVTLVPGGGGFPSTNTVSATIYVTTAGSDSNNCLSWSSACATVNHALSLLPANGGVVEVGYGQFSCWSASGQQGFTVEGQGLGPLWSNASTPPSSLEANTDATQFINTTSSANCITISGTGINMPQGQAIVLRNFAVYGTSSTQDGINIVGAPSLTLDHVRSQANGRYGIYLENSYWVLFDTVWAVGNTNDGFHTATVGGDQVNLLLVRNSQFDGNSQNGMKDTAGGHQRTFLNTDFSYNSVYGASFTNDTPYVFIGDWFENNSGGAHMGNNVASGGAYYVIGCEFAGNSTQYGIGAFGVGDTWVIQENSFSGGDTVASILNGSGTKGHLYAFGNVSSDTSFIDHFDGTNGSGTGSAVAGSQAYRYFSNYQSFPQTLSANGAVTFDASKSDTSGNSYQQVTLAANATSSSITNAIVGQTMTIQWIENSTGGFTYVWPTNTKFTSGSAPSGTTLSTMNGVTFLYDGTNWVETARSTAVPYP